MAKTITLVIPHSLGAARAKQGVSEQMDRLKAAFIDRIGSAEVIWTGYHADVRVAALGQIVTAKIDVLDDSLRLEVALPWLLASLSPKVETFLQKAGQESLQITSNAKRPV
jgi:hypothetical protein